MKRPLFLLLLLFGAAARAQSPLPDPADVARALDDNPSVLAARSELSAARAAARALSAGTHEFIASASVQSRRVDREGDYAEYDAALMRAIRLPGKSALDRRAGEAGIRLADNRADDARHQAAIVLNELWWEWLGAAAGRRVLDRSVETHAAAAGAVGRRLDLREAARLELDQAASALALARAAASRAEGRERAARAALASRFPDLPLPAEAPALSAPQLPPEGLDVLGGFVVQRSHEIGAVVAAADQAGYHADRMRRDRLADPSVGIRGFSERDGAERGIGLLLSFPIGGSHRAALAEEAGARASAARARAVAVRQEVAEIAARDVETAKAAHAAWAAAAQAAGASGDAAARAARGHALGGLDLTDRLYAERIAQEAAMAEVEARTQAWHAITRLRIDSHTLWMHVD
jgi:outer membrane protein TolC